MTGEGYKPLTDESVAAITSSYFAQRAARSSAQDQPRVVLVGGQLGQGTAAVSSLVHGKTQFFQQKMQKCHVPGDSYRLRLDTMHQTPPTPPAQPRRGPVAQPGFLFPAAASRQKFAAHSRTGNIPAI